MAEKRVYGICLMKNEEKTVCAEVKFVECEENGKFVTHLKGLFKGLPSGPHGFHIHEFGDMSKGCESAGPHFNPFKKSHGGPSDEERHVGDFGNVVAVEGKDTEFTLKSDAVRLTGENSIFGRSLVIHADEDDLGRGNHQDSKTTGHSGARLACGIIARSGPQDF